MKLHLLLLTALVVNTVSFSQLISFKNEQGKYGFKSANGTIKIQPIYDVVYTTFQSGRLCVNKGFKSKVENRTEIIVNPGKWGFIDETGKEVIPLQYQRAGGFIDGIAKVMLNDKWGFIDSKGKFFIKPIYTFIEKFEDGIAVFNMGATIKNKYTFYRSDYVGGKWGAIDKTGKTILLGVYDKLYYFSDHKFFSVSKNNLSGILSPTGSAIIPVKYSHLQIFSKDCFLVKQNNKYGALNLKNEIVIPFEYTDFPKQDFSENFFLLIKEGKTFKFDLSGKALPNITSPEPYESSFQKALAAAANSRQRGDAINQYVTQLHTTQLTEDEKTYLLGEKFKQVVDIDYHGMFEAFMRYKNEKNNAKIYLAATKSLTKEQASYITVAAKYVSDEYVATSNNRPAPEWPNGLPKPGYGWNKTVSSNKPGYASNNTYSSSNSNEPAKPTVTEWQIKSMLGYLYKESNTSTDVVIKILSYNKKYDGNFEITYKRASISSWDQRCIVETKTADAEKILYGFPSYYPYDAYLPAQQCNRCNGKGTTSTSFSHTNDYEYTYGAKVTYNSTSTQSCSGCSGSGMSTSLLLKPLATCLQ